MREFREMIYNQHDTICNQKYGNGLPYSFHLKAVEMQGMKFIHLLGDGFVDNPDNYRAHPVSVKTIVLHALIAHDVIEDGRWTYNNVIDAAEVDNFIASKMIADIVYCVTDEKGKTRGERKNEKYYAELKANELAIFVKLADLAANTLYSKLTGSNMYDQYKSEFPKFKEKLFLEEYKEFFDYVENL